MAMPLKDKVRPGTEPYNRSRYPLNPPVASVAKVMAVLGNQMTSDRLEFSFGVADPDAFHTLQRYDNHEICNKRKGKIKIWEPSQGDMQGIKNGTLTLPLAWFHSEWGSIVLVDGNKFYLITNTSLSEAVREILVYKRVETATNDMYFVFKTENIEHVYDISSVGVIKTIQNLNKALNV